MNGISLILRCTNSISDTLLNCALFQGPPRAVRAYLEEHAARGSHMSRPDRLPLSAGLASTGSPASRNEKRAGATI